MKHLVAFLKLPNKKHALDQQAITKFGLMARLPLSDKELRAVAEWAWDHSSSPVGSGT